MRVEVGYFKGSYREKFYQVLWNWMECETCTCPVTCNTVLNVMDEMEMKNCAMELKHTMHLQQKNCLVQ